MFVPDQLRDINLENYTRIAVAFSGGLDSSVLLHSLANIPEYKERVRAYMKKLGFESEYDLTELTGKGKELLNKKIKELKSEWGKLVAIYKTKDGKKLKQEIDNYRFDFPMMLYMGFSSGFIMSSMFNSLGIGVGGYLAEDPMMLEPIMEPRERFKKNAEKFGFKKNDAIVFKIGQVTKLSDILN